MNCEKCSLEIKGNWIHCKNCEVYFHIDCVKNNRNPSNEIYCAICGSSIQYNQGFGV